MLNLFGRLTGKKAPERSKEEVKCPCGETALRVPNDFTDIYLCQKCNKLLYYAEPSPSFFKVKPLSLAWLKRKK